MRELYLNNYANELRLFSFSFFLFFLSLALLTLAVWVYSAHFVIVLTLLARVPLARFTLPSTKDCELCALVHYLRGQQLYFT